MNSGNLKTNYEIKRNPIKSNNIFENLKNNYFLEKLFNILDKGKSLCLLKYNKNLKKRINITIKDYKEYLEIYSPIEIKIKPVANNYSKFLNINDINNKYYHVYFNNNKEEIKRNHINNDEQIKIIKIIIDFKVKSFKELFKDSECVESINFNKFHRNNIDNMSSMFEGCHVLEYLDLSNFNTMNVIDMGWMFTQCFKLSY